ncbi:hypothetical protein BT69DRAFT_1292260 [Atractiella rhizophila]|nr:hypothetical protein BT69DRAFT_1292260 [Atractiella rhizophila]
MSDNAVPAFNPARGERGHGRGGGRGRGRGVTSPPVTSTSPPAPITAEGGTTEKAVEAASWGTDDSKPVENIVWSAEDPKATEDAGLDSGEKKDESAKSEQGKEGSGEGKKREKKPIYNNPDRHKTGGPAREKLTEEELAAKMEKIRLQNERLKARKEEVDADESAYTAVTAEEIQAAKMRREKQLEIDAARQENAKRKLEAFSGREWDSEKGDGSWDKTRGRDDQGRGGGRGGGGGRGRGRGRGTGRAADSTVDNTAESPNTASTSTSPGQEKLSG